MKIQRKLRNAAVLAPLLLMLSVSGCGDATNDESTSSTWKDLEAAAAADPNLFASGLAGVAVTKPSEWRFVANDEIAKMRGTIELRERELEEMMKSVQLPVVSIMKYADTHVGVNPTVQVGVRSKKHYSKTNPSELLRQVVAAMVSSQVMPDLKVLEDVHSTQIDGIPAAIVTLRFTLQRKSGEKLSALSKMFYAINSKNVIIVGMSGPVSGPDRSEKEFTSILQSLRLAK